VSVAAARGHRARRARPRGRNGDLLCRPLPRRARLGLQRRALHGRRERLIFDEWAGGDLYPADKRSEIDALNEWIYGEFQNGVYRAGFARSQEAYDAAYRGVFAALDRLEGILADRRYLTGDTITEADWRLLPTLLRFDAVYHTHFRCNGARLIEYPNLLRYTTDLYNQPHVAQTFALDEIKRHYYTTHDELNPKRIIPGGPTALGFR
jgi:putative glutathione S-transferase